MNKKDRSEIEEKDEFPKQAFVYVCDYDEATPLFSFSDKVSDCEDGFVAEYKLVRVGKKQTKSVVSYK